MPQDVTPLPVTGRFAAFPESLFERAEAACNRPNESFVRLSRDVIECRLLLPPGTTAAVILDYGGSFEALPQAVIRFSARPEASGYLVEIMPYLRVPRRGEPPLQVVTPDAVLVRQMRMLLTKAGGQPL